MLSKEVAHGSGVALAYRPQQQRVGILCGVHRGHRAHEQGDDPLPHLRRNLVLWVEDSPPRICQNDRLCLSSLRRHHRYRRITVGVHEPQGTQTVEPSIGGSVNHLIPAIPLHISLNGTHLRLRLKSLPATLCEDGIETN